MRAFGAYFARRLGISALVLLLGSIFIFVALRVIPGDPTTARATLHGVTAEQLALERTRLGLDRPILEQYARWIGGVVRGDFGESYFSGFSTTRLIAERIGPTIELTIASVVMALLIAIPAAVLSALRPHSRTDRTLSTFASVGLAVPPFFVGILLIALFAVRLGWLPSRGYVSIFDDPLENAVLLLLPATTLSIPVAAAFFRYLRASLFEVSSADFTRTAEGKGLLWRQVIVRHVLPNGFLPTLTFVGLITGTLLGGVVVIEFVFGWRGLGALAIDAVGKRDYAVLQGVALVVAASFLTISLVVDLLSFALDPRLRAKRL